jgi:hypothetical protein
MHSGIERTYANLSARFYWKGMFKDCADFVKGCLECQVRKSVPQNHGLMQLMETPDRPFYMVGIDHVGPFPATSRLNQYLLVITDYFTKWVEVYPCPSTSAQDTAIRLHTFIMRHGVPSIIVCDQGSGFTAHLTRYVAQKLDIQLNFATPDHHQSNGQVERFNRYLCETLATVLADEPHEWDMSALDSVLFTYRTTVHKATGETPFFLVHGRDAVLPIDFLFNKHRATLGVKSFDSLRKIFAKTQQVLEQYKEKSLEYKNQGVKDVKFKVGELVLLQKSGPDAKSDVSSKLQSRWTGPWRVTEVQSDVNYAIEFIGENKNHQPRVVHISRLKRFVPFDRMQPDETTLKNVIRIPLKSLQAIKRREKREQMKDAQQ